MIHIDEVRKQVKFYKFAENEKNICDIGFDKEKTAIFTKSK